MSHLIKKNHRIRAGTGLALICWLSTLTQGLVSSISPFCLMQWFFFFQSKAGAFWSPKVTDRSSRTVSSLLTPTWKERWFCSNFPSQRPESHSDGTGLGHWRSALRSLLWQETAPLMESVSLELHESSNGILGTGGRRKWTVDSGKTVKNVLYRTQACARSIFWSGKVAYTHCS